MTRHRSRDRRGFDDDWYEVQRAYGRYSATDQGDRRRDRDRRRLNSHGRYEPAEEPGYEPEHAAPGAPEVYDPDHEYRRYEQRDTGDFPRRYGGYGPYEGWGAPRGRYAGIGPKDYVRSDDRIREDVCDGLMRDPDVDARHIEVRVKDGEVLLGGTVENRGTRRRAEDLAEQALGVKHVQNNLRVAADPGPGQELSQLS